MARNNIDNLLKYVTVISTLRGVMSGGAESSIRTAEKFSERGQAARSNALNVLVGLLCLVGGVGLHLCGWTLASGYSFEIKGIVIGIPIFLVLAVIPTVGVVANLSYQDEQGQKVYPIPFKWAYLAVIGVVAFLSFGILAILNYEVEPWKAYTGLGLAAVGPVVSITGWVLSYNGICNLKNPYGWRSPGEEEIQKPIANAAADLMRMMMEGESDSGGADSTTIIEVHAPNGNQQQHTDFKWLGVDPENFAIFARAMTNKLPITEAAWGHGSAAFPRGINQFREVRTKMTNLEWIEPVNPNNQNSTYRVTDIGDAVFRRLAEEL